MQGQTLHALARLARLDKPTGTWLALLPAWWCLFAAAPCPTCPRTLGSAALFAIGAVAVRGAGCAVNDAWDRDIDRRVSRTADRPVARGALSVPAALALAGGLGLVGALVLAQFNALTIAIGLAAVPLIALYPLAKRVTWWPQVVLAAVFNLGALMGWAASTGTLAPPAFALYTAAACWTLGYDTIYARQDAADDARAGVKSSARALGRWARPFVGACYALTLAFVALSGVHPLWLVPAGAHLAWQVLSWRNPGALFAANRDAGLLILWAVVMGRFVVAPG